ACIKVCGIVDEHVDAAEPVNSSLDGSFGIYGLCNVQFYNQQVLSLTKCLGHLVGITASGNDSVACGQSSLRNVDAHAAPSASDKPNFTHDYSPFIPSLMKLGIVHR